MSTDLRFVVDGDDVIVQAAPKKLDWIRRHLVDGDLIDETRSIDSIVPSQCNYTILSEIIGHARYMDMVAEVYGAEVTMAMDLVPGAFEGLGYLSRIGLIHVLSARDIVQTENLDQHLVAHNARDLVHEVVSTHAPTYAELTPLHGSKKVAICNHMGASMFVDDDYRHMPSQPVDGLRTLLFGDRAAREYASPIVVAKDWTAVVRHAATLVD